MREDLKNYNARHHGIIGLKQTLQLNGFKPWCLSTLLFCLKYSLDLLSNILTPSRSACKNSLSIFRE